MLVLNEELTDEQENKLDQIKRLIGEQAFSSEFGEEDVEEVEYTDDMDVEEVNREHGLDGVRMVEFDEYGIPLDGYDYYKHIVNEPMGEFIEAIKPSYPVQIKPDTDLHENEMNKAELEVFKSLEDGLEYEELDDDFVL
jgi:hypothetical protein